LLKRGVSIDKASTELTAIATQLALEHPENQNTTASFGPFVERSIPARVRTTLVTMLGAVFGVMLIACVNVTNLQLARAMERAKEVAIRSALGSSRWRIVRQLLVEGLLLSAVGSLIGLAIAQGGAAGFMRAIADTRPPFWIDVRLDPVVLLFVAGITVATALVSSVMPGWRVARTDVNAILNDETRGTTGLRMGVFSRWLVVIEVTASCVLLIVSGLMIRSILATSRLDYPFPTKDVFMARMILTPDDGVAGAQALEIERIEARVASVPGVRAAALSSGLPGGSSNTTFAFEGEAPATGPDRPRAGRFVATPGFFRVMRVAPVAGRMIDQDDRFGKPAVAVVDQTFARRYLSAGPVLGRRFRFDGENQPWLTIVGVVPDLAPPGQSNPPPATVYAAMAQSRVQSVSLLAWTANDPVSLTAPIRAAVAEINDRIPVTGANSAADELWRQGWALRVFGGLFLVFGFAALILASAGLYGVMAFSVRRRTQEIGVRMALGASRGRVMRTILWQGLWRVAVGVALGLVPGWFVGTLMRALLEHVDAADPIVHTATVVTLLAAGVFACLVPALRAASVDPLTALRRD
jgi:predicted permease